MLVYCDRPSSRAEYIIRQVLEGVLSIPVRFAQGKEEFRSAACPRLHYGQEAWADVAFVPASGALEVLSAGDPPQAERHGMPVLHPVGSSFDLFAAAFHLLSLVDELRVQEHDAHGRVPSAALFTVRSGLAEAPWVDRWALSLGEALERRWPGLRGNGRRYAQVVTVDMDNLLRYAGRPLVRALGATAKDALRGAGGAVVDRWSVRSGVRRDPYLAVMDRVEAVLPLVDRAVLFLLLNGQGRFDHALALEDWPEELARRIRARDPRVTLGLHPSYNTSTDPRLMHQEIEGLRRWDPEAGHLSRQHFLRWHLPDTLHTLEQAGMREEHSLGFMDRTGFRAATCTPFPWYDLEQERAGPLRLCPFAAMDSALIEQQGCGPQEVMEAMVARAEQVRAVGGTFVSVWHDRYLSGHREFAPWPSVFEATLRRTRA